MKCGNVFKQKKMKTFFEFKKVSVTVNGDYYQIVFDDGLDTDDEPYFMIQRQFEFPDGGVCQFESHLEVCSTPASPGNCSCIPSKGPTLGALPSPIPGLVRPMVPQAYAG